MLSTDYNFIFIHIPKTAGTSITAVLNQLPRKKTSRLRELLLFPRRVRSWRVGKHDTALTIRNKIGKGQYERFFTFAVVRNPWDLMVSTYHWWTQKAVQWQVFDDDLKHILGMDNFEQFVRSDYGAQMINEFRGNMLDWVTDERGNLIVDYVARLEHLSTDWKEICSQIGIPHMPLPRRNTTRRKSYQEYYSQETKELVAWRFQKEIEMFKYYF